MPGMLFFVKGFQVLDVNRKVISESVITTLSELGILVADHETDVPILYVEKPTRDQILQVLERHNQDQLFVNAFFFGFSTDSSRFLVESYGSMTASDPSLTFFETKNFDFSTHIVEPICLASYERIKDYSIEYYSSFILHPSSCILDP